MPQMAPRAFMLFALSATIVGACIPPHCDRPDFGTCVNACCKLEFAFSGLAVSGKELVGALADAIKHGGPDQRYVAVENNTVQPWSEANDFVVQAIHETAKHLYNDTLHFAVSPPAGGGHDAVIMHAFSHSQDFIKGNFAYGDHGQNYKNIVTLVNSLKVDGRSLDFTETTVFGCPAPKPKETAPSPKGKPCCQGHCADPTKAKYYSVAKSLSGKKHCGECCMDPKKYNLYHFFEKNLTKADNDSPCRAFGYTVYDSTDTHGFGPVSMTLDLYNLPKESIEQVAIV